MVCFPEEEENTVLKHFMKRFLSGVMYTFWITGKFNSVSEAWEYFVFKTILSWVQVDICTD